MHLNKTKEKFKTLQSYAIKNFDGQGSSSPVAPKKQEIDNSEISHRIEALEVSCEGKDAQIKELERENQELKRCNLSLREKLSNAMRDKNLLEMKNDPDFKDMDPTFLNM